MVRLISISSPMGRRRLDRGLSATGVRTTLVLGIPDMSVPISDSVTEEKMGRILGIVVFTVALCVVSFTFQVSRASSLRGIRLCASRRAESYR